MALHSPVQPNATGSELSNQHSRTYQACIPCRRRKVRCDLGPVDNPHEPPCVRCRREAKECFFSATRRKRRASDSGNGAEDVEPDDYEVLGGRKRLKNGTLEGTEDTATWIPPVTESPNYASHPLTPHGSVGRRKPLRRPTTSQASMREEESDEQVNSHTTAILQTAELHSGHDALNVLIEAATHHRAGSTSDAKASGSFARYTLPLPSPSITKHATAEQRPSSYPQQQYEPSIDPMIMQPSTADATASEEIAAFNAWSRFRFVRNGWFTAQEGMAYLRYFYTYLSPLTPIAVPDYQHAGSHAKLLEKEPLLAVTIIMITSRYMALEGTGATGRAYAIHGRLWPYTQRMIDRLVWGREQSGSAFSAAEAQPGCDVSPLSRKGYMSLGTVESLMLLTEWHSRLMHFPADEDDAELMAPEIPQETGANDLNNPASKPISSWMEPCYRSDRMCWMLLSLAMSVAFQIGVFDKDTSRHTVAMSSEDAYAYEHRRSHVRSLLLVYVTQTSGRLGITAMLPEYYARPTLSEFFEPVPGSIKDTRDLVIHFWLRLAAVVKEANEELYPNRQHTRNIIRSGRYIELLQGIQPSLVSWRKQLNAQPEVPTLMRHILLIEYEHSCVILYQLSLQAAVERCINNSARENSDKPIPPHVLEKWYGNDRQYVRAVMESCRNVLRIVVDGLAPGGYLKHAPVRTFFRIVSVTMVLVKTFAFGAFENEMSVSLNLMDRTVEALSTCVVDDVHLANRFAEFIKTLIGRIRKGFVRMGKNGNSRGTSQSPAPPSVYPQRMPEHGHPRALSMNPQPWSYNENSGTGSTQTGGRDTPLNNALYGISRYDYSDNGNSFSVMPPPTNSVSPGFAQASYSDGYGSYGGFNGSAFDESGYVPDWLALPLDPLLQSNGLDVTQTGFGPGIGDFDMLDVLLGSNNNG